MSHTKKTLSDIKKRWKKNQPNENDNQIVHMPVEQLEPCTYQPRRFFAKKPLQQLADSISEHGVVQPILVRPVDGDRFEIIAGERRWRASQMANKATIPVIIQEKEDDEAARLSLIENLQREELDPIEEAIAFQRLMTEFEFSQKATARSIGKSESYITRALNLIKYTTDETRSKIITGELKPNSPEVISEIKNNKKQDPNANKAGRKSEKNADHILIPKAWLIDINNTLADIQGSKKVNADTSNKMLLKSLESAMDQLQAEIGET